MPSGNKTDKIGSVLDRAQKSLYDDYGLDRPKPSKVKKTATSPPKKKPSKAKGHYIPRGARKGKMRDWAKKWIEKGLGK